MRKIQTSLFFLFLILAACKEDADKVIHTNLPLEATQLLETSTSWGESIYFTALNFQNYERLDTLNLPGCPTITIEEGIRSVELDFDNPLECNLENSVARTGKITINYGLISLESTSRWTVAFENYSFGNVSITGSKTFNQSSPDNIQETFENLTFKSSENLSTTLSGTFNHTLNRTDTLLNSISTSGVGIGTNPAGRTFDWEITEPRITDLNCLNSSEYLPQAGKENWTISRSPGREVIHSLEYIALDSCKVQVDAKLSDGRNLILNP